MSEVEVTRADREAAWEFRPSCYKHGDEETRKLWMAGTYDYAAPVIRAFARHRLATSPTASSPSERKRDENRARHLFACAIYDSENTGRLQEHPEGLTYYLMRADALRHHMRALGIDVTILEEKR